MLLAAWLLAVVGGALAGTAAAGAADRTFERQWTERHEVVATIVANPNTADDAQGTGAGRRPPLPGR